MPNNLRGTLVVVALGVSLIVFFLSACTLDEGRDSLWQSNPPTSYRMVVEYLWPPVPPVTQEVFVEDGMIVQNSILACDTNSDLYSETLCDPIQTYYPGVGVYTVDKLLADAETCIEATETILTQCSSSTINRSDLTISDLVNVVNSCPLEIDSNQSMCIVEYDTTYGYPKEIVYFVPQVVDGSGRIRVTQFEDKTPDS